MSGRKVAQGFGGNKAPESLQEIIKDSQPAAQPAPEQPAASGFQATQDAQAQAVATSAGIVAQRGMQQLQSLQNQQSAYVEQFSDAASDLIVSTEAAAWMATAEKVSQKLGSYSPVDTVNVFNAFSLNLEAMQQSLRGIAEPAALCAGKSTAGF